MVATSLTHEQEDMSALVQTHVPRTLIHAHTFSCVVCVHCSWPEGFQFKSLPLLQGWKCSGHLQHCAFVRLIISSSLNGSCSVVAVCLYACVLPTQLELKCILKHYRTNSRGRWTLQSWVHFLLLFSCMVQLFICVTCSATCGTSIYSICRVYEIYDCACICVPVRQLTTVRTQSVCTSEK